MGPTGAEAAEPAAAPEPANDSIREDIVAVDHQMLDFLEAVGPAQPSTDSPSQ